VTKRSVIGILGLGLMGGSLGYDLSRLGHPVLGVSRSPRTCARACTLGITQAASTDWQLLAKAEVIFVCVPMDEVLPSIERLAQFLPQGVVVTDRAVI